jgi:hypothetical protein
MERLYDCCTSVAPDARAGVLQADLSFLDGGA